MHQAMARLISLAAGFVLNFAAGPPAHAVAAALMMISFITIKSSLVPLIEGLCAQI